MLEMLRALAQSEAEAFPQLSAPLETAGEQSSPPPAEPTSARDYENADWQPPTDLERSGPSGLTLLRTQFLGAEPDDTEQRCRYCNCMFRLRDGGASFEGNFACANCEQQLNRDVVLPAVSKHRPNLYQVCEVASGPDEPKRPAWARRDRSSRANEDENETGPNDRGLEVRTAAAEDLQEAVIRQH